MIGILTQGDQPEKLKQLEESWNPRLNTQEELFNNNNKFNRTHSETENSNKLESSGLLDKENKFNKSSRISRKIKAIGENQILNRHIRRHVCEDDSITEEELVMKCQYKFSPDQKAIYDNFVHMLMDFDPFDSVI